MLSGLLKLFAEVDHRWAFSADAAQRRCIVCDRVEFFCPDDSLGGESWDVLRFGRRDAHRDLDASGTPSTPLIPSPGASGQRS